MAAEAQNLYFSGMSRRAPTRADNLRSAVAEEAARLMAEHGIHDFRIAKKKAAERYGVVDGSVLPKNTEIEAALVARQRLFGQQQHLHSLDEQRRVAITAMRLLQNFEPRLVGPVLSGSATEYADIQLHVFSDNPEAVFLYLMEHRYDYEVFERKLKMQSDRQVCVPAARFAMGEETIEAVVFTRDGIRQAPVSPVDGKPMRRAALSEVQGLRDSGIPPPG
jgi:hypothetical protein